MTSRPQASPFGTILLNCTRSGETRDLGPYDVQPPPAAFIAYVRQFIIGKGWTINSVTQV